MKSHFTLLFGIILSNGLLFAQINDTMNDLKQADIAGKVETIEECYYNSSKLFKRGRLTHAHYTSYSRDGYIIESGDLSRITRKRKPDAVYSLRYVNGKIEGRYKQSRNGGMSPVFTVRYDSLDRIIELIRYYTYYRGCSRMPSFYINDGGNQMTKRTYSYDDQGKITKCEEWDWTNEQWKLLEDCSVKNDLESNEAALREDDPTDPDQYVEFSKPDEHGNWTLRTEYQDKEAIEIMKRKIKYF